MRCSRRLFAPRSARPGSMYPAASCARDRTLVLLALGLIGIPALAAAADLGPEFARDDEVIAQPVTELSCGASPAAAFSGTGWHVVWAGDGDIWMRSHDLFGWGPPARLSNDPAASRDPHVAAADGDLIVVWEDDRTGHSEIWSRRWNGSQWEAELCLSDDSSPSRRPAIAGDDNGAFVVWEDGAAGSRTVLGRFVQGGQWGPVEPVGEGSGEEFEPSIDLVRQVPEYLISWTDTRSGTPEIHGRTRSSSGPYYNPPRSLSATPGPCGRSSVRSAFCCADVIMESAAVVYENDQDTPEIYGVCWYGDSQPPGDPARISPNDGIPSRGPCAAAFDFHVEPVCGALGGPYPACYVSWSNAPVEGLYNHEFNRSETCPYGAGPQPLSTSAHDGVQFAAATRSPYAQLIAMWIEDRDGVPSLIARRSTTPECYIVEIVPPRFALFSPGGSLTTIASARNECGLAPVPGVRLKLDFSDCSGIQWDPQQPHPITQEVVTNGDGQAVFRLRGGGCVRQCPVHLLCDDWPWDDFNGVKSPDIDGDCIVTEGDQAYVASRLGTSDFCADLDGSGWVNDLDLAIVDQTMGEACSPITAAPAAQEDEARASLRIRPNPARGPVRISLRSPAGSAAADGGLGPGSSAAACNLLIVDAGGRLVRRYDLRRSDPGNGAGVVDLLWDTRDGQGRLVPSGIYVAAVRGKREVARAAIIVLR